MANRFEGERRAERSDAERLPTVIDRIDEGLVIPLKSEELSVSRRTVERAIVRVETTTSSHSEHVDETLNHENVRVERVPVGRFVEAIPPVRQENGRTVLSVVEEVVVVERRLFLKEEVHVWTERTTSHHIETVELRRQDAVVTRIPADDPDPAQSGDAHGRQPIVKGTTDG